MTIKQAKVHFWHMNTVACTCHDVGPEQATANAEQVTCLRCANTVVWRAAMALPAACTARMASAICKNGRQVRFERTMYNEWTRDKQPMRFALYSRNRLLWRKVGDQQDEAQMRAAAGRWAAEHGFHLRGYQPAGLDSEPVAATLSEW